MSPRDSQAILKHILHTHSFRITLILLYLLYRYRWNGKCEKKKSDRQMDYEIGYFRFYILTVVHRKHTRFVSFDDINFIDPFANI